MAACLGLLVAGYFYHRAERVRLEGELERRDAVQAALDELRHGAGHGYLVLARDGTILEWNKALEDWTGWPAAEMVGQSLERVMTPERWEKHKAGYSKFMSDPAFRGARFSLVCELRHRDDSRPPLLVEVNARAVEPKGFDPMAVSLVDRERLVTGPNKGPSE